MSAPRCVSGWLPAFLALLLLPAAACAQAPVPPGLPTGAPRGDPNGVVEYDADGDGSIDYRVIYDRNAQVAREELDFNLDGTMDTFYYSEKGVLQREEIDTNADGRIDLWVYLLDGTYVRRYERDLDGDGTPDLVRDFGEQ